MKHTQTRIAVLLALLLALAAMSGCGGAPAPEGGKKLSVVTTIFPEYDWVRLILGGNPGGVELTLLLDNGADLHSYQPTADDMVKISTCDLFLYVGGESDEWVEDALREAINPDMTVINLLEVLGDAAKEEETVEGMQEEEHSADGEAEEGPEYDEHVWLSLRNAALFCREIAGRLGALDPENRALYTANADAYIGRLDALDAAYTEAVAAAPVKTVLFGARFPFRYLVDDYGLGYYAAFSGCSAEAEASFETVVFLANKVDELGLRAVLTIETGDGRIARTIIENTAAQSARVLQMDSMQGTTAQDIADGGTYLGAMEQNLETLRQALA